MKFRTKIKISFLLLIFIPITLLLLTLFTILKFQTRSVQNKYGIKDSGSEMFANQTKVYSKVTENIFNEVKEDIKDNPQKLVDLNYIRELDERLDKCSSFLIVKRDDTLIYDGCENTEKSLTKNLPNYNGEYLYPGSYKGNTYIYGDYKYLIKQLTLNVADVKDKDGYYTVTMYIVTCMDSVMPQIKKMIIEMLIAVIAVIILASVVLMAWIQRSIAKPLEALTVATKKIAAGDLDFKLERTTNDEFGELCDDFEEMRIRLKQSAEDRIRYDEENKELISNISHDLKTPITSIKGYIEGIRDGVANTPEKMDKYIKTIYNKANDMDRLIGELTMYSKIDNNTATYNFQKVNVDEYFSDCVEEISVELESKNINLTYFNYADKDTIVIADPEQLKRVINNIISNSVKYIGHKKGAVNIRIGDEEQFVHVQIEDNGKGIGKKELPYIFDRFYRTDSSRNSGQGGSGIGLSIAKKIIEMHGGRIWASSMENTGTIIHFELRKYYEKESVSVDEQENIDY